MVFGGLITVALHASQVNVSGPYLVGNSSIIAGTNTKMFHRVRLGKYIEIMLVSKRGTDSWIENWDPIPEKPTEWSEVGLLCDFPLWTSWTFFAGVFVWHFAWRIFLRETWICCGFGLGRQTYQDWWRVQKGVAHVAYVGRILSWISERSNNEPRGEFSMRAGEKESCSRVCSETNRSPEVTRAGTLYT